MGRLMPPQQLKAALGDLKRNIDRVVAGCRSHQAFLDSYCAAEAS
jgi:tryptophan halogenase